jgi:23S rRNA (guanine2445-N2)-methyltransferase / 23S rRNA (guanine2069-N7)-methyltransferase
VTNLRVYDADLPDFKVAVDVYGEFVHVQEYAAPKSIPLETAKKRFNLALHGVREALQVNREQVFIKTRARQSGNEQYEKKANSGKFHVVSEPTANNQRAYFFVNFSDYLDTGLFLDHRSLRKIIAKNARGKTVLNLFAYTCTASVHAALGGAKAVTSVDLSQNYLDWGRKNFALNGLPDLPSYQFIAQDIFEWIKSNTEQYDVIFIDPPTFSNSKKFQGTFDVQRDHVPLINRAMNRLSSDGVLYFSNNFTKFVLDDEINNRYHVEEMTNQTIGFDFDSKRPIHQSWAIRHK